MADKGHFSKFLVCESQALFQMIVFILNRYTGDNGVVRAHRNMKSHIKQSLNGMRFIGRLCQALNVACGADLQRDTFFDRFLDQFRIINDVMPVSDPSGSEHLNGSADLDRFLAVAGMAGDGAFPAVRDLKQIREIGKVAKTFRTRKVHGLHNTKVVVLDCQISGLHIRVVIHVRCSETHAAHDKADHDPVACLFQASVDARTHRFDRLGLRHPFSGVKLRCEPDIRVDQSLFSKTHYQFICASLKSLPVLKYLCGKFEPLQIGVDTYTVRSIHHIRCQFFGGFGISRHLQSAFGRQFK